MPFLGVTLEEIDLGLETKPAGCDDMRWCRTDGGGCMDPGGLPSHGQRRRMEYVLECQKPTPIERLQCNEALYDRETKTWACLERGYPCGFGPHPACARPKELSTWTEDLVLGVTKRPVTPEGRVIYDDPKPPVVGAKTPLEMVQEVAGGKWGAPILIVGAAAIWFFFGRR